MDASNELQPLIDKVFDDKVGRARDGKHPGELSLAGFELIESALPVARDGMRHERPDATDEEGEAGTASIERLCDTHGPRARLDELRRSIPPI